MADKKGSSSEKTLYCSFCGKSQHEVKKLIAGSSVFICDECIGQCNEIIREELPTTPHASASELPTPAEIKVQPGQLRHRPRKSQAYAGRGGLQPLQTFAP